uniref:C2H2-type domain-containing protein n=1 Tax=Graphocephala atropunctata TaxID=36148 RepID=A0A1B6KD30_9HEMI
MEYKSPLDDAYCNQPRRVGNEYNQQRSRSRHDVRYSPYSRNTLGGQSNHESSRVPQKPLQGSNSGASSSTGNVGEPPSTKYMDQYRSSSYPKELTILFQALDCRLCLVELSSPIVAKMHYSGKQHMKKVTRFLTEWCGKTGSAMPQIEEVTVASRTTAFADYCELCDVRMITTNDKMLHYTGKNHRKNEKDPDNAKKKKKVYDTIDVSNSRFGIGADFSTEEEEKPKVEFQVIKCDFCDVRFVSQDQLLVHLASKKHQKKVEKPIPKVEEFQVFDCKICDVKVNSQDQLQIHLDGKKHKDKVEKAKPKAEQFQGFECEICEIKVVSQDQLQIHLAGKKHKEKVEKANPKEEVWFQCELCDVKAVSQEQLQIHLAGKKHKDKAEKRNVNSSSEAEKPDRPFKCDICEVSLSTKDLFELHTYSKRHVKALLKREMLESNTDVCDVCNLSFTSIEHYQAHIQGRKHQKKCKETNNTLMTAPGSHGTCMRESEEKSAA